jgi:hypothetical protein
MEGRRQLGLVGDASHRAGLLFFSPVAIPIHFGFGSGTIFDTKRLFDSQAERAPTFGSWRWPALERRRRWRVRRYRAPLRFGGVLGKRARWTA